MSINYTKRIDGSLRVTKHIKAHISHDLIAWVARKLDISHEQALKKVVEQYDRALSDYISWNVPALFDGVREGDEPYFAFAHVDETDASYIDAYEGPT